MSDFLAYLILFAAFLAGLLCSYGLALLGEPSSKWLWCDMIGARCLQGVL